ncbi:MAG: DUF4111 domain-containing protein [Fimbriimonadaceae bacterium]|nr:DUF4111 domain-containing protein [Fimbriimonadaceae bacterium]
MSSTPWHRCTPEVRRYLLDVSVRLEGLGCRSVMVSGSLAFGAFEPRSSDIDIIAMIPDGKRLPEPNLWLKLLSHHTLPCPAIGLELLAYRQSTLRQLPRPLPYVMAMDTGSVFPERIRANGRYNAGILDLEACRQVGFSVSGAPPRSLINEPDQEWLSHEVKREMRWAYRNAFRPGHDPSGAYAVLTLARGACYLSTNRMVSKSEAARWFSDEFGSDVAVQALVARSRRTTLPTSALADCRKLVGGCFRTR